MANCANCGAPPLRPPSTRCHVCGGPRGVASDVPTWAGRVTSLSPAAALSALAQAVTARGAHVTTQSGTNMTGTLTVRRQPNVVAATLLFLLCIVPMIIYMIVQSRPDVYGWSIQVTPEGEGSRVTYSAQGGAGSVIFQAILALP